MRKLDEIALYAAVRSERGLCRIGGRPVDEIAAGLGINPKRALSLAEKWYSRGWIECGVSIRCCWFTLTAPRALLPWGVVA